jgi:serine/threonine protein phosphatase 1
MWSLLKRPFEKKKSILDHSFIDRLTYAIGDIHGRNDLFCKLLAQIRDQAEELGLTPRIVLLGDYVDRGPDSSGVLDTILDLEKATWCTTQVLLGNHEAMLKRFLSDSAYGADWSLYGGAATLASYGVTPPGPRASQDEWLETRQKLARNFPLEHALLLDRAKLSYVAGDYLFVHGGVKPDILLWIRDEFLASKKACDYVVVHGHSARESVSNVDWRIGVDTGAYATGILTAVQLRENSRTFLSTTR